MVVAAAAPPTPVCNTLIKKISRMMFVILEIIRYSRGWVESPVAFIMPIVMLYIRQKRIPIEKILKYVTEPGIIFSGVFIHLRMVGVKATPKKVSITPARRPKAKSVCIAFSTFSLSPAPIYLPITTPAPVATPWKKPVIMKIKEPEDATEARASAPRVLPTIRESAVLYNC